MRLKRETISKYTKIFIPGIFVFLYVFVSTISMLHVIDFFELSNTRAMSIALAIAFELGAAASLASIIIMERMNKWIVWGLFIVLTSMQSMGNTYNAYAHLVDFQKWIELFGLTDEPIIAQKRILAIISGAILPIVALGFIKALVDYLKIDKIEQKETVKNSDDIWKGKTKKQEEEFIENYVDKLEQPTEKQPERSDILKQPIEKQENKYHPYTDEVKLK